jgi:hypothetical protein
MKKRRTKAAAAGTKYSLLHAESGVAPKWVGSGIDVKKSIQPIFITKKKCRAPSCWRDLQTWVL